LPELASICSAKLICDSLQHIKASNFSSVAPPPLEKIYVKPKKRMVGVSGRVEAS
jgi:hypothetical protein